MLVALATASDRGEASWLIAILRSGPRSGINGPTGQVAAVVYQRALVAQTASREEGWDRKSVLTKHSK